MRGWDLWFGRLHGKYEMYRGNLKFATSTKRFSKGVLAERPSDYRSSTREFENDGLGVLIFSTDENGDYSQQRLVLKLKPRSRLERWLSEGLK